MSIEMSEKGDNKGNVFMTWRRTMPGPGCLWKANSLNARLCLLCSIRKWVTSNTLLLSMTM